MRVVRTGAGVEVGDWPAHPERTALVEARGALLAWDVLSDNDFPAARVHDEHAAAEWLWEVYGPAASLAADFDPATDDPTVLDATRVLAQLTWAEAWWPASVTAGVPGLDEDLWRAERAVATAAAEHLLDDPDAVAAAFDGVVMVEEFAEPLRAIGEDYGVAVGAPVSARRAEFALAAGSAEGVDVAVLSGSNRVEWSAVPRGAVDVGAEAAWSVVRADGTTFLEVVVPSGDRPVPLRARFGAVELPVEAADGFGRLVGRVQVPPTVLFTPPEQRVLTVFAPGFAAATEDDESAARRAALIEYARGRVGAAGATVTERLAGR